MEVKIISKPSFSVIGKVGQGSSDCGPQWIKPLWDEANSNFSEISHLAKRDESGKLVGIWGLMSDVGMQFKRWGAEGMYLAGCEVGDNAEAPESWTLWAVPSQSYVVTECTLESYGEAFDNVLNSYLPNNGYELIGAVHEYYPQEADKGTIHLYFPIARG